MFFILFLFFFNFLFESVLFMLCLSLIFFSFEFVPLCFIVDIDSKMFVLIFLNQYYDEMSRLLNLPLNAC